MAWYEGGDWTAIRRDRQGHLLQQMMYAVNEREAKIGVALTNWAGLGGTYPEPWEVDGLRVDRGGNVLESIRAALPDLYDTPGPRFYKIDGTNWTEADLLAEAGYGAAWLPADGATADDVRPMMQTRRVIESLSYYIITTSRSNTIRVGATSFTGVTEQAAYDLTIGFLNDSPGTGDAVIVATLNREASTYPCSLITHAVFKYGFPSGFEPLKFVLKIEARALFFDNPPVDITLNGASFSMNGPIGDNPQYIIVGEDVPLGNTYLSGGIWYSELEAIWVYPAAHPFTPWSFGTTATQGRQLVLIPNGHGLGANVFPARGVSDWTYG